MYIGIERTEDLCALTWNNSTEPERMRGQIRDQRSFASALVPRCFRPDIYPNMDRTYLRLNSDKQREHFERGMLAIEYILA